MVDITIDGENVVFEVLGWDKILSLRSRLTIPITHIEGAHADPEPAMGWFDSIKVAGAGLPNFFQAGIFFTEGRLAFWDVRHPENTIVVELNHENFSKLIIEVADPAGAVAMLKSAIGANS